MSLDQQIREGLEMLDQKILTPDVDQAYDVLVREARTVTARTRFVQGGLLAAALVAVLLLAAQLGGDPSAKPAPVDRPDAGRSQVTSWDDLAGTWRTADPVTAEQMAERVRSHGHHRRTLAALESLPGLRDGARLTLTFDRGQVSLFAGAVSEDNLLDRQGYVVDEDVVWFKPMVAPGGRSRFTAVVDGAELELRFFDTTVPPSGGLDEETMQAALFTTAPFEWVGEAAPATDVADVPTTGVPAG